MALLPPDLIQRGAKFGLLYACLLGLAMTCVIFVGSVIGDCDPSPGCHDNDVAVTGLGILSAVPIITCAGMAVYVLAKFAHRWLEGRMSPHSTNWLLGGLAIMAVWATFDLAMMLHVWLRT